ncbi:peroxiredoxin (alkyl hydroperoxide reductase subunit C) [Saccharothrix carnea]|uniref:Alkyl hydroperoxide reductase E n=1 Tax=Saccharothrix carnea TaxID=1280637 RepID=A0A2P8IGI5_SACCR|nr:peroxiredoxin [Saccharothrix carnea]PSL57585.1 peroxiredoxin (alkyl hydroperoxide reductase subunit C) [Saccharothrix carnea]
MAVEVGSPAPDFTLSDHNREVVTASSLWREKNLLVIFYPFAFSTICQDEMCLVRDDIGEYATNDVQVVGVSTDTPFALKAWAEQQGYDFPLLSDFWPHGEVAGKYGVFLEEAGIAMRGTFLVDTSGVVRFAEINGPREARDQTKWKKAVAELTAA